MPNVPPKLVPILLLIGSNLFMTTAWCGHRRFKDKPLWIVILFTTLGLGEADSGLGSKTVRAKRLYDAAFSRLRPI
jgi:uncharacterized protein (DUF486 family)